MKRYLPAKTRAVVAAALLAVFGAYVAVPVAQALVPNTRCCGPGRCCHHPRPATSDCLRSVCPCGGHESTPPASPVRGDALLKPRVNVEPSVATAPCCVAPCAAETVWRTRPVDHPPPSPSA